jgi:hypothetical protein
MKLVLCGDHLTITDAAALVGEYLNPSGGYAWPAYDTLVTNGDVQLVTGDLLAPTLLDAPVDASRYRALMEMWHHLAAVGSLPPRPLEAASDEDIEAVARLFAGLDAPHYRRAGVRGTIVSKVLHRKRPDLVPLYDSRIDTAYRASGLISRDPQRPWVEFMALLCRHMRADLQANADAFAELQTLASEAGAALSRLRILDILVWMSLRD